MSEFVLLGIYPALPQSLQKQIERSMKDTANNSSIQFTVATNYGGREEIIQACRAIASLVKEGNLQPEEINEAVFENYLYTKDIVHARFTYSY